MSVRTEWQMQCPKCCSDEGIEIEAVIFVTIRLMEDGTDDGQGGDTEWSDDSGAACVDCGFHGTVKDFEIKQRKGGTVKTARSAAASRRAPQCRRTSCRHCEHDIEGFFPYRRGEWRDRGNNTHCPDNSGRIHAPYIERGRHADK